MKNMEPVSYKKIWAIAYPIGISLIMEHLIGLTDTAFLGRVGEIELGASALGGVYFGALFMLGLGFSIGAQIMIARRNGEQRYREIGPILQLGTLFTLLIAAAMIVFSKLFSPALLGKLIQSRPVYEAAMSYLDWRIWGLTFAFVSLMFRSFYVGTTHTRIMTWNSIVMVLSNVVLNYALIFGKFGLPEMGIAGAAIASTFAEFVSMAFYILYTAGWMDWRKYRLFFRNRLRIGLLGRILNISGFVMIQYFLAVATWFIFFLAIEHQGERPLAVTNLVRSLSSILFFTVSAFSATTATLAGNLMGAGRTDQVMPTVRRCMWFAYACLLPLFVIYGVIPGLVLRLSTNNWELIGAAVPSLWVMASSYLIATPGYVYFNAISGSGNTRHALLLEFVALFVYTAYILYVVVYRRADVALCWTAEHVYGILMFVLAYWYLKRGKWQGRKI
jgi:putative MATE family efflux protein